jgi:hypothetical protein
MPPNVAVLPLSLVGRWKTRLGILFMDAATAAGYGPESTKSPIDAFDAAQHGYRSPGWTSELKLMDARYRIAFAHEISDANFQENVADYLTFAMSRSNLGSRTGFLISPYAPEGAPLLNDLEPKVAGAVRTFASVGAVLDLRSSPDLVSEDFYDSVHLLSSGRRKLWIAIRSYLLANLNGCSSKAGST